ncbi:hypothetical protein TNCV_2963041 [Trichonephila clavipes]|nr:hypothetical protein TNCV_2963041 [Trichonephila clavipes]
MNTASRSVTSPSVENPNDTPISAIYLCGNNAPFQAWNMSPFGGVRKTHSQIPFLVNSKNRADVKITVVTLGPADLPSPLKVALSARAHCSGEIQLI